MVKGVTLLLFLDKDKDRFDHPDINRFYAHYPSSTQDYLTRIAETIIL